MTLPLIPKLEQPLVAGLFFYYFLLFLNGKRKGKFLLWRQSAKRGPASVETKVYRQKKVYAKAQNPTCHPLECVTAFMIRVWPSLFGWLRAIARRANGANIDALQQAAANLIHWNLSPIFFRPPKEQKSAFTARRGNATHYTPLPAEISSLSSHGRFSN